MGILVAVEKWRSYLQLAEFEIHTDQQALVHLNDQRLHTVWQQKFSPSYWVCATRLSTKEALTTVQLMHFLDDNILLHPALPCLCQLQSGTRISAVVTNLTLRPQQF